MELIIVRDIVKRWSGRVETLRTKVMAGEMRPAHIIDELNSLSIESAALKQQLVASPCGSKEESDEVIGLVMGFCAKAAFVASEIYKLQRHGTEV